MSYKNSVLSIVLILALFASGADVAYADDGGPLKDSSFELKLPKDDGGWDLFEISLFSKNEARSGSQSMFNGGFSRSVAFHPYFIGNESGAYQEFPASPGSRWRLTGYGLTNRALEGTAFGILQISFFDTDDKDLGTVETAGSGTKAKTSDQISSKTAVDEWIFLDTGIATAPEGTATIQAFTIYIDYSGSNTTQGVYFDDLSLCVLDDDGDDACGGE